LIQYEVGSDDDGILQNTRASKMPIEIISLIVAVPCLVVVTEQLLDVLAEMDELIDGEQA